MNIMTRLSVRCHDILTLRVVNCSNSFRPPLTTLLENMKDSSLEIQAKSFKTRIQLAFYILFWGKISIDRITVLEALEIGKENLDRFNIDKKRFERNHK